jgi:OOP family OmpA-OmpF porin
MNTKSKWIVICAALVCWIVVATAYADDNVKVKGLITGRSGETLTLKTSDAPKVAVVLTDDTKIEEPHGAFGMKKKHYNLTSLVPGLAIEVEGTRNSQNQIEAKTIKFSKDSLQTAQAIQAGLMPTEAAVAANKQATQANKQDIQANQQAIQQNAQQIGVNQQDIQDTNKRFNDLSDYEVKGGADVFFPPGGDKLSEQDKAALTQLASLAKGMNGYLVQVKGYADSTGNPAMNQQLSLDRSEAVIAYLEETGGIPVIHIVAPGAMGTSNPAASNETAQGRAENRRVEVKVLVNKGLSEK